MTPMNKLLTACVMSLAIGGEFAAYAATLPTLPAKNVDVTMPTITGSTFNATCATLQSQLNAAAAASPNLTHEVILATGTICSGIRMPAHASGTGWILLKGANYANLPPSGTRVGVSDAALMPVIQYNASNFGAIAFAPNARRYRIIGISLITTSSPDPNEQFVDMGYANGNAGTGYIIIDRCVMRELNPTSHSTHRAVYGDAEVGNTALIDSYMSGVAMHNGSDSNGWLSVNNPGPILIRNNFIEAASENINFCGAPGDSESLMPKDITIQRNTMPKLASWVHSCCAIKAIIEFKCGLRILVEGNTIENNPYDGLGWAFRITPRNDNGTCCPWGEVSDLTVRSNLIRNNVNVFQIASMEDGSGNGGQTSRHSKRFNITNNLIYGTGVGCGGGANCGRVISLQPAGGPTFCQDPSPNCMLEDLTVTHNTIANSTDWFFGMYQPTHNRLDFRDNVIDASSQVGLYACTPACAQYGTAGLNADWGATWAWTFNSIAAINNGVSSSQFPQGNNNVYYANSSSLLFTNAAANDYTLQTGSPAKNTASDSKDRGVDFVALNAALAGSGGGDVTSPAIPKNVTITLP